MSDVLTDADADLFIRAPIRFWLSDPSNIEDFLGKMAATLAHYKALAEERERLRATDCKSWEMRTAIAEQALASQTAPEGWKLVPREPTPEMIRAGEKAIPAAHGQAWIYAPDAYKAMIAASPDIGAL